MESDNKDRKAKINAYRQETWCFLKNGSSHLALMRYWARLMLAGVPVMVIWRSDDPSMALAILICAPDI